MLSVVRECVCGVLLKIARSPAAGLLVCLDDLHWADPLTRQLLRHLVRKLDEAPSLLVCSYRSWAVDHYRRAETILAHGAPSSALGYVCAGVAHVAGHGTSDGGLLVDLSKMKGLRVDAAHGTAVAQPGLRLGEFDRATREFGLATPLGIVVTADGRLHTASTTEHEDLFWGLRGGGGNFRHRHLV
jgi:hypothetical protein